MGMKAVGKGRPKSKRQTLKDKYSIQKKIKEHKRKAKRDERRNGGKQKLKKDPGVPRLHPFREEILRDIEESKQRVEQQKEERRKQLRMQAKYKPKHTSGSLEELAATAQAKGRAYEAEYAARTGALDVAPGAIQDGSRKAFYREFKKVVEAADVILQVLDARDPLGSRSPMAEQAILNAGNKKLVLVLNKIDLVPREVAEAWLKHLRNEFPTIAFKASRQQQKDRLHASRDALGGHAGSGAQGTGVLMKLLGNYCRNLNIKTAIRVGVVGYPNVGKSSIINSLKRSRVCGVGATPGFTRTLQEIVLDKHIKLLDSPGIVFSTSSDPASLVLRNCVRTELLDDPVGTVEAMLTRCQPNQIMEYYSVPLYTTTAEFLQHLARRLGKLKRGGVPDLQATSRIVLQDFNQGNISYYVEPPVEYKPERQLAAEVVTEWSEAFNIGELMAQEESDVLPTLKPKVDYGPQAMALKQGALFDEEMIDENEAMDDGTEDVATTVTTTKKTKGAKRQSKRNASAAQSEPVVAAKAVKAAEPAPALEETEDYDFSTDFTMLPTQHADDDSDDDL
eukprot:TRINITY_DN9517_c0_g1_i1.p1 TRINITY_DN9517_c0_g1~~TRINITY_DN9517_c0_g1_i1.p1  ORF type:complete len:574 (+),score=165.09 TRINITY_DN9517_c0_g1_i1:33-1724(+)